MTRLISLNFMVAILLAVAIGGRAEAQSWVQVEAQPNLAAAEDRARAYARAFPNVAGYELRSGWYAIALGPFDGTQALQELQALRAERLIPRDSFVADGSNFARQFWPAGAAALSPQSPTAPQVESGPLPDPITAMPLPSTVAPADETPAEARRSERLLTREQREALQIGLRWAGFYDAAIDGAFGPGTRSAMAAWQSANGFDPTGVLTTSQRQTVLAGYQSVLDGLGLAPVRDETAGIQLQMPTKLVRKTGYEPPFAKYEGDDTRVILISQKGDRDTLAGLYEVLQTLEIVPLNGARQLGRTSFRIDGANDKIATHAEAQLTRGGTVKGFILVWKAGDEKRRQLVLEAMQTSFTPLPDAVLPDNAGEGAQAVDLLAGLQIRQPDVARSGFYIDAAGLVLTSADAVAQCKRITLDDDTEAEVAARDPGLGIAVLKPTEKLVPIDYARFQPGVPRLQSEVAVSGYSYGGRLGASTLTYGTLAELKGLNGETTLRRLALNTTPGDAGGPVFDVSGAVLGLLLPPETGKKVLPDDTRFAADAAAIAAFLSNQGFDASAAEPGKDLAPEDLLRRARDMTVQVSCWN